MADEIALTTAVITLIMKLIVETINIFVPVSTALKPIPIFLITIARPATAAVKMFMNAVSLELSFCPAAQCREWDKIPLPTAEVNKDADIKRS